MNNDFEEKKEKNNDRKNVVVLTIIALATLLVVVAGATFAYLASTAATGNNSTINATTEGDDTLFMIEAGDPLQITATPDNFGTEDGDVSDEAYLKVVLASSGNVTYDYDTYVNIESNDFEYTSGSCYKSTNGSGTAVVENAYASTEEECNNQSGFWATDGTSTEGKYNYKCYEETPALDEDTTKNNQAYCTIGGGLWKKERVPELVLDFYAGSKEFCEGATGTCVNSNSERISDIEDSEACSQNNATNRWIENVEKDGICYIFGLRKDLTEEAVTEEGSDGIIIDDSASISVDGDKATQYIYAKLSLVNFEHNQIINGHKEFNGQLIIKRVDE